MFDPYKKWLGIQAKDQPPNHYRLLSLDNFERDLDVIEGAADRQMGFVRQYQSGEHAAVAAKVLNEIASARLCLLKPASKAEYDAKLKKQISTAITANDEFPQLDSDPEIAEMLKAPKLERKRKRKKSKPPPKLVIAGAVVGVIIIGLLINSTRRPPVIVADPIVVPVAQPIVESKPASVATPPITKSTTLPQPSKATVAQITSTPAESDSQMASNETESTTSPSEEIESTPTESPFKPAKPKPVNSAKPKPKKARAKTYENSEQVGGDGGIPFELKLNGKPMLGVVWTPGMWAGSKAVATLTPVSSVGSAGLPGESIMAPKGFAVGGMNVNAPKYVSNIQLIFMKLNDDGTLDPETRKLSKWMGGKPKGDIVELSGEGKKVVGIYGRKALVVDAIGLIFESEEEE